MDDLQAGRELDALVAEKVMGMEPCDKWEALHHCPPKYIKREACGHKNCYPAEMGPPYYSTDIAAAWELVEKFKMSITPNRCHPHIAARWCVDVKLKGPHDVWLEGAETAPLAICRAALKAVEEIGWDTEPGWRYCNGRYSHVCKPNQAPVNARWIISTKEDAVIGMGCPKCLATLSGEEALRLADK